MKNYIQIFELWFKRKALIDETLMFKGSQKEFLSILEKLKPDERPKKFYLSSIEDNKFKITDIFSIGIMILNYGRPLKGITIDREFKANSDNELIIRIKSKLRIEIYIVSILAIGFYLTLILSKEAIPWYVFFFPIIPIPWFIWIYKIQTIGLLKKTISYLRLEGNKINGL
jgi:hypothetical protein